MFEATTEARSDAAMSNHARAGRRAERSFTLGEDDRAALARTRPAKGERPIEHHVKEVPGMVVRVTSAGGRTFVVRKRGPRPNRQTQGRLWDVTIGPVGSISVQDAK